MQASLSNHLNCYQYIVCANTDIINGWFDVYEGLLQEKNIENAINIWNVDECSCIDTLYRYIETEAGCLSNQCEAQSVVLLRKG